MKITKNIRMHLLFCNNLKLDSFFYINFSLRVFASHDYACFDKYISNRCNLLPYASGILNES